MNTERLGRGPRRGLLRRSTDFAEQCQSVPDISNTVRFSVGAYLLKEMFKPRFSMASALVMIVVMILIAVWMMREEGTGFETTRGVPFVWYHWADYKHASPFNLFALAGDIVFWLPIVLSSGFLVEKLIRRFETRGKHRS